MRQPCVVRERSPRGLTDEVAATRRQEETAGRAMQVFGAGGFPNDTPLAFIHSWGRPLRTIARAKIETRKESGRTRCSRSAYAS